MDLNGSKKQKTPGIPNQDWTDWLSNDDPSAVAKEELRKQRVRQAGVYTPRGFNSQPMMTAATMAEAEVKSVVINLHLPKLSSFMPTKDDLGKLKTVKFSRRQVGIAAAVVLVLFLVKLNPSPAPKTQTNTASPAVVQGAETSNPTAQLGSTKVGTGAATASITQPQTGTVASVTTGSSDKTNPSFTPIVPSDEPQLKKHTFGRTTYSSSSNVYTIMDSFGGSPVTINETTAPAGESAQSLAKQNATKISPPQTINLPSGEAYLTAPMASGQQTAVLAVGNVVIFVNSNTVHSVANWQAYLSNLK